VYRGSAYPQLYGWYICIDFYSANGWLIKPNGSGGWIVTKQPGLPIGIAGFGEDENGELFAASAINGTISQVVTLGVLPLRLTSFTALKKNNLHEINWSTSMEQNLRQFEVLYSSDGNDFKTIGTVPATNSITSKDYRYNHLIPAGGNAWYRLKTLDNNGKTEYSAIIKLGGESGSPITVFPTVVRNGILNIRLNKPFRKLQLVDMNGRLLRTKIPGQATGLITMDIGNIAKGTYILKCSSNDAEVLRKIVIQ